MVARRKKASKKVQDISVQALFYLSLFAAVVLLAGYLMLARWQEIKIPAAVVVSDIVSLTNVERSAQHVGKLTENALLDQAAQAKADDMARQGYFSHTGLDGRLPWAWISAAGYDYHYAGENLAVRFSDSGQVVSAWMASPTHRANIIKPQYTQIGVGVADGMFQGLPATFVVQFFGTPAGVTAAAPVPTAHPTTAAASTPASKAGTVAGASTTTPAARTVSLWDRIVAFFAVALNSLSASAVESQPVEIGPDGASTQRSVIP